MWSLTAGAVAAPQDLHGKDLRDRELENENLDRANLSDANLQGAKLTNATMKGANLKGANLERAHLATADLSGADLRGANLKQATLEDAKFIKAILSGTDVYLAYGFKADEDATKKNLRMLDDARVNSSVLAEHNGTLTFKEADLRKSKFHGSLDGVDFRRADLRGADLSDVREARKAKWKGSIYDSATRWPAAFDYAEAGAVAGPEEVADAAKEKPADVSSFDPAGVWMIKVEAGGATEDGLLTVGKDQTYKWDYAAKAEPIEGTWKRASSDEAKGSSGAIVLSKGEGGENWVMTRDVLHRERPDGAQLRQADGQQKRWIVPVSLSNP